MSGLLDALRRRPPGDPAISPDGRDWLDVAALLRRAAELDLSPGAGAGAGVAVRVPTGDPVETVTWLLAAERLGAVPVLAAPDGAGSGPVLARAAGLRPDQPLLVVVTSGSSGRPRAVVRTQRSWWSSLTGFDALLGDGGPVWVPGGPAATLTLFGIWHALATGRPVVASGRWRGTDPGRGAASPLLHCVPAVLADVLDARAAGRLPALRRVVVAGAALGAGLRARATGLGVEVGEYYGAAELSFVAADPDGSGLRAFPGAEVAVRDGVIRVRSPYLALGYLDPDDDGPLRRDPDGWATVGDRGALTGDGVLTVHGRGDDTASVGGHLVLLADVERVLGAVPGVAELVCVAEPDRRFGQRVLAVLRPAGTPAGDAAEGTARDAAGVVAAVRAVARTELPRPARPVRYLVRATLPRTAAGKVARAELAASLPDRHPR